MLIIVNGESREVPDGINIAALIEFLSLAPERLAVERNRELVRRSEWTNEVLAEGDAVEIIHFVGGGEHARSFINRWR